MNRRLIASVLCAALVGLLPPPAGHAKPTSLDEAGVPRGAGHLRHSHQIDTAAQPYPAGTEGWYIEYDTTTPSGRLTPSSGLVLVPPGDAPPGGWPVVAWDHGTTGIGDTCAPSGMWGAAYGDFLGYILGSGYAIAATDYAGLGTAGIHPYLISESEARATVDSVRAARNLVGDLSTTWVAAGHSQGGQAAVATAEIADDYDGALDFRGAAAFAPAPNMTRYVDAIASPVALEQQFYSMMLVGLKTQHPTLDFADYLRPGARALLDDVRNVCFDALTDIFDQANLPTSEFEPVNQAAVEQLRQWFRDTEVGHQSADAPLLVMQGTADHVVPVSDTGEMVAMSQANGSVVDYRTYEGGTHGSVLGLGLPDLLDWLATRFASGQ